MSPSGVPDDVFVPLGLDIRLERLHRPQMVGFAILAIASVDSVITGSEWSLRALMPDHDKRRLSLRHFPLK